MYDMVNSLHAYIRRANVWMKAKYDEYRLCSIITDTLNSVVYSLMSLCAMCGICHLNTSNILLMSLYVVLLKFLQIIDCICSSYFHSIFFFAFVRFDTLMFDRNFSGIFYSYLLNCWKFDVRYEIDLLEKIFF